MFRHCQYTTFCHLLSLLPPPTCTKRRVKNSYSTHLSTIKYKFAGGICQYLKWEKYTTSGVFSKLASQREFLSPGYIAFLACTVGVLGDGT